MKYWFMLLAFPAQGLVGFSMVITINEEVTPSNQALQFVTSDKWTGTAHAQSQDLGNTLRSF